MGKDHATSTPIPGFVQPRTRRCIADTQLLRQRQRNTALLQVGGATAARQGSLERGKLLGEIRPRWRRITRHRQARHRPQSTRRLWYELRARRAALVGWRPLVYHLAPPLLLPVLAGLRQIAPGATRKAHEAASCHRDSQATLVVRAVERAQGA